MEYLRNHPGAHDTLEDIVNWWLHEQTARDAKKAVKEAIDRLEAAGLIRWLKGADGRLHYRPCTRQGPGAQIGQREF